MHKNIFLYIFSVWLQFHVYHETIPRANSRKDFRLVEEQVRLFLNENKTLILDIRPHTNSQTITHKKKKKKNWSVTPL